MCRASRGIEMSPVVESAIDADITRVCPGIIVPRRFTICAPASQDVAWLVAELSTYRRDFLTKFMVGDDM